MSGFVTELRRHGNATPAARLFRQSRGFKFSVQAPMP
jgi:hypothetical protein